MTDMPDPTASHTNDDFIRVLQASLTSPWLVLRHMDGAGSAGDTDVAGWSGKELLPANPAHDHSDPLGREREL